MNKMRYLIIFLVITLILLVSCNRSEQELVAEETAATSTIENWPPAIGETYPNLQLINDQGNIINLADYQGKTILLEIIGMSCPACQAFAGAHKVGGLAGVKPQSNLPAIEDSLMKYGDIDIKDSNLLFIQVIFFNMGLKVPDKSDLIKWSEHFAKNKNQNHLVLGGIDTHLNKTTYDMVPGFHLISKDYKLLSDSTGHYPRDNLYSDLIPRLRDALKE